MLQCVPLADSCLAYGAQACRTAIQAVAQLHEQVGVAGYRDACGGQLGGSAFGICLGGCMGHVACWGSSSAHWGLLRCTAAWITHVGACGYCSHVQGVFGEAGRGARVIYAQTDSVFIHFPNATAAQVGHCVL